MIHINLKYVGLILGITAINTIVLVGARVLGSPDPASCLSLVDELLDANIRLGTIIMQQGEQNAALHDFIKEEFGTEASGLYMSKILTRHGAPDCTETPLLLHQVCWNPEEQRLYYGTGNDDKPAEAMQ